MESSSTIIVALLVGLPGSGKSSLARSLCQHVDSSAHIEYDQVAASLGCENNNNNKDDDELKAWRQSRTVALHALVSQLENNRSLIIMDDNFHLRSMRKAIYRICQEFVQTTTKVICFGLIFLDTPLHMCLERNASRSAGQVASQVIEKMSSTLEPPNASKASWEACTLHISSSDSHTSVDEQEVLEWLENLREHPVPPPPPPVDLEELERARQATRESRLHQYDQLMRSWVSEVASMDKQSARVANDARKEMLADLRSRQDESIESLVKDFCRAVSKEWSSEQKQVLQSKLLNSVQDL